MEPLTGVAGLVLRFGIKKLAEAILGEGVGELLSGLVDLVSTVEQSQERLEEIDRKLDILIAQRYSVAVKTGAQLLRVGLLRTHGDQTRERYLDSAEQSYMEAVSASTTALQESQAQRALAVVRIARRDSLGARVALKSLDLMAGASAAAANLRYARSFENAEQLYNEGKLGKITFWDRAQYSSFNNPRIAEARIRLKSAATAELEVVSGLMYESFVFARMVGEDVPTHRPLLQQSLPTGDGVVVFVVEPDEFVSVGGISLRMPRADLRQGGQPALLAPVDIAAERAVPVYASLYRASLIPGAPDQSSPVAIRADSPSRALVLPSSGRNSIAAGTDFAIAYPEDPPLAWVLEVSGMAFTAASHWRSEGGS